MKSKLILLAAFAISVTGAFAQRNRIRLNPQVTTHIIMPETLKLVDISTPNIVGDQCSDNMVRIKPLPMDSVGDYSQNDFLGTVTLIGERHMVQYDVLFEADPLRANSIYNVAYNESQQYSNPEVSMPESEMAKFAWAIYGSQPRFNGIRNNANGMDARVCNVYSIGNYFFIDFYLKNRTNIDYDIAELRVKLTDKKEVKATNSQTIELTPAFILNRNTSFKKDYRQVIVLDKLTFPNEKVLNIEIAENQISGRVITLSMEYEDILNADGFEMPKSQTIPKMVFQTTSGNKRNSSKIEKELQTAKQQLVLSNAKVEKLSGELKVSQANYKKLKDKLEKIVSKNKDIMEIADVNSTVHDKTEVIILPDIPATASIK